MQDIVEQEKKLSNQIHNIIRIIRYGKKESVLFLVVVAVVLLDISVITILPTIKPDIFTNLLKIVNVIAILSLVWGIILVWKQATPPEIDSKPIGPSVIKGPFPFNENEGDVFLKLGREADIGKILGWVVDDQICFTSLQGESGAGKTSLLRAGLAYTLNRDKEKYGVTPVYWEATPENSAEALLRAIHIKCPDEKERLTSLDDVIENPCATRKVIIIDQAEQLSLEKQPEIFDLFRKILAQKPPYTTTWIIAFRDEFSKTWYEFECSIPDFHPPKHSLKTFTEDQAQEILAILSHESKLSPDNAVLKEMVTAMSEKGKVSPVEIGISMLMLYELYCATDGNIAQGSFRMAGGVTGLLRSYIHKKFEEGIQENEHSDMEKALLDLRDPEDPFQRLSVGKSVRQLAAKTRLSISGMQRHLNYFASPRVRILEKLPNDFYRIAHERLIPALESLSGVLLAKVEQAKQVLNERFHTWQQARRGKFLLSGKELHNVLKHREDLKHYLSPDLTKFIRDSRRRRNRIYLSTVTTILLIIVLWQPINNYVKNNVEFQKRKARLKKFEDQFVPIQGGEFMMGDSLGEPWEKPPHRVKVSSFEMSRYEITNQQYCDFLNSKPDLKLDSLILLDWSEIIPQGGKFDVIYDSNFTHPIAGVTWFGAASFCNYMSEFFNFEPCYNTTNWQCDTSANGYRLPTEAEWEYAARGGQNREGKVYAGADSAKLDSVAWYYKNSKGPQTVGIKKRNELGLYDMSGNVWEWCNDWYSKTYYEECFQKFDITIDPLGPKESTGIRVLRGGSWGTDADNCRVSNRIRSNPSYSIIDVGFRCVRRP